jgi:hypothetical protein
VHHSREEIMAAWTGEDVVAMEVLSAESVRSLLEPPTPPCLSLYLPTHRPGTESMSDRPSFEHLVRTLEHAIAATTSRSEREHRLNPLRMIATDVALWQHVQDGLAVFAAGGSAKVFRVQWPVQPLALVGARFHTLPLIGAVASLDQFHVLTLTSRSARAWSGRVWHDPRADRTERLDPIGFDSVGSLPMEELTRSDVISEETCEPHRVKHGMGQGGRSATAYVHGGFDAKQDDLVHDTEIFFRHVDTVVAEELSRRSRWPLVLVASPRVAAVFRGISANPYLLDDPVGIDPHLLTADELAAAVAPVFRQARTTRVAREVDRFGHARDHALGSGDLAEIAWAAAAGQVDTLLVSADRFEIGRFDRSSGRVQFEALSMVDLPRAGEQPAVVGEDLYGAVAETVFTKGGTIVMLAPNEMPTETGLAAIYRYA